MKQQPRYSIKITENDSTTSYLSHKGKLSWCLRTAKKYAEEHWLNVGVTVTVEDQCGEAKAIFGW